MNMNAYFKPYNSALLCVGWVPLTFKPVPEPGLKYRHPKVPFVDSVSCCLLLLYYNFEMFSYKISQHSTIERFAYL